MILIQNILDWKARKRTQRVVKFLSSWIGSEDTVLDFGAGDMGIALELVRALGVKIQGIDVMDVNKTNLPFCMFDGLHIPFPDQSFDVTYAMSVFHHVELKQQKMVFQECLRVSKKRVLIHEDIYANWFELQIAKLWDFVFNKLLFPQMPFPFAFRKTEDWISFFTSETRVKNITVIPVRPDPLRPTRHVLFVIDLK